MKNITTPEAAKLQRLVDSGEFLSGDCYISSRRFAMKIEGDYVEGTVFGGYPPRKILHAWVEKDNVVYDPTIPEVLEKEEYYKIYRATAHHRSSGLDASLKSARENRPGPVGEVPAEFEFKDGAYRIKSFKEWLDQGYEKGQFIKTGEDPNGHPPDHILYSPQFTWRQNRKSIIMDALRSWKGDPVDMAIHMRDEMSDKPIPESGSGKIRRIQAKTLLNEIITNPSPAPTLYRGDIRPPSSVNSPVLGWTSDKAVAQYWARKYKRSSESDAKIYVKKNARGLDVSGLFGDAFDLQEKEWVVGHNIPEAYRRTVLLARTI